VAKRPNGRRPAKRIQKRIHRFLKLVPVTLVSPLSGVSEPSCAQD
jgi:hypothetical protein